MHACTVEYCRLCQTAVIRPLFPKKAFIVFAVFTFLLMSEVANPSV